MSQMVIRESGCDDKFSSSDNELSDWEQDTMDFAKRVATSANPVDKRLINMYLIRIAHETGV